MANIKSQKKRILITAKENERNKAVRSSVKNAVKKFDLAVNAKDLDACEKLYPETVAVINHAKNAGVLHANAASRRVATVTRKLDALRAEKA